MNEIWAAAITLVVLFYLLLVSLTKKNRLPPGPIGLPIIGHLHLLGNNPHQDLYRLARKHGPIMHIRMGFVPTIVVSSPAAAELILKTHDLVFADRPQFEANKYIGYDDRGIIFGHYGPHWRNMRKLCTLELLSQLKISQFQAIRKAEVDLFVSSFKLASGKRETVDFSASVSDLSTNIICLMVFGKKYENKDMGDKGFKKMIMETVEVFARPNLVDYFPYLRKLDPQGLTPRMKVLGQTFDGFLEKVIEDHVENKLEKTHAQDFVDIMMAMMKSGETGFEFDRRQIKAVLLDMFIAGSDTSATTAEWTLSELIRHPTVMEKLQKELESVVGMEHMVEESHLESLQYLDLVVKEILRLHPVAPLLLPRESMEDCLLGDFYVPKGSRIMVNAWAIGRDPDVWPNPEKFSPERFIGSNVDFRGRDFQFIPFGSGRRSCPGMQLGLTVVRLMVAQLVHCFDWELPNGMLSMDLDMSEHFGLVTSRAQHLMVVPTYRLLK